MVATFVGNHPHSRENTALEKPINRPRNVGKEGRWEEMEVGGGVVQEKDGREVANQIEEGAKKGSLEAMGRNSLLEVSQCEWWLCVE
ncbi:hypothetical protein Tsubulata_041438 [Turnera subulata]|uniref:Uncharacterized protein n=1 Tax=Turnera subulata TaxID=218843 RepID=A0A9Q0JPT8_9ROSI|nr:hypothetical protein Tsubulata_041438 [Turnera subulata]